MSEDTVCDTCNISFCRKADYNRHLNTAKHMKLLHGIQSMVCEHCSFTTANTYEWNRHLNTAKHKKRSTLVDSGKNDYISVINKLVDENRDMRIFLMDEFRKLSDNGIPKKTE